jgi:multiple sugar transport system permease protein
MTREQFERRLFTVLRWVGLVFFTFMSGFPLVWMIVLSFRPLDQIIQNPAGLPTWEQITAFQSYIGVWVDQNLGDYILNSAYVSLATVALTLVLSILGAYAMTRLNFRGRDTINAGVLLIYMFPAMLLAVPLFVIFTQLGLRNSLSGLVLVYLAQTLPVALYMLRSYFQTLPAALEEAALIDGCTRLEVIRHVVIPLSLPAIASVSLYVFMIAWNEFLFALLWLLERPDAWTLSLGVQQLDSQEVPRTWLMAGSVIVTIPVVVLFFVFERFLTRGLTAGAVKG